MTAQEKQVVLLTSLSQFINILDFMIVMPMGPDFALSLDIPLEHIGILAGAYAIAAALAAILLGHRLDSFERRQVIWICLVGLGIATLLTSLSTGFYSLISARALAGAFGGIASSISMSMIFDFVRPHFRGRAMAWTMGALSGASVIGVPLGLELSNRLGWQTPFVMIGILTLGVAILSFYQLPKGKPHLAQADYKPVSNVLTLLSQRPILLATLAISTMHFSMFCTIPHLATYFQFNREVPRDIYSWFYMAGGIFGFVAMQLSGRMMDKLSAFPTLVGICITALLVFYLGFIIELWIAWLTFMLMMGMAFMRNVATQTYIGFVPKPSQRAAFNALTSAWVHGATGLASAVSAAILVTDADHAFTNFSDIVWIALALAAFSLLCLTLLKITHGEYMTPKS